MMAVGKWVNGYKVTYYPWIDGKMIYFNVRYYKPGASLAQPPALDKTVYMVDNKETRDLIDNRLETLIQYIVSSGTAEKNKKAEVK